MFQKSIQWLLNAVTLREERVSRNGMFIGGFAVSMVTLREERVSRNPMMRRLK